MMPLSGYLKPIESHQWVAAADFLLFQSSSQTIFQVLNVFPKMLPIAQ
jgi:hypothetical protein